MLLCSDVFFVKQKTAYEMRISDWSSDVCSSDLLTLGHRERAAPAVGRAPYSVGLRLQAPQFVGYAGQPGAGGEERPPDVVLRLHHRLSAGAECLLIETEG